MTTENRPNIVLIMCDQQGANAVGCYGAEGVRTDRIDALAAQGTRFERAYAACPVCTPRVLACIPGCIRITLGPGLTPCRLVTPR